MSEAGLEAAAADYAGQIREYLTYCQAAREHLEARGGRLDPKYHPSADGAVKMISHGGDKAGAEVIRRAFGELTSEVAGPGAGIPEPEAGR